MWTGERASNADAKVDAEGCCYDIVAIAAVSLVVKMSGSESCWR